MGGLLSALSQYLRDYIPALSFFDPRAAIEPPPPPPPPAASTSAAPAARASLPALHIDIPPPDAAVADAQPASLPGTEAAPAPAPAESYDGAFDDDGLSALEKIYLFSQSTAQFHRVYIAHALPDLLAQVPPHDAVEYVLPLLSGLAMDDDETVKEALAAELVHLVWWFALHCQIIAEDDDGEGGGAGQEEAPPLLPAHTFTPIIGTLLLSSAPVGATTRSAVVDVLRRLHDRMDDVDAHARELFEHELIHQVVIGIGRLDMVEEGAEEEEPPPPEGEDGEMAEQAAVGRLSSMSLMAAVAAGGLLPAELSDLFVAEVERVGSDGLYWVRKEASYALGALAKVVDSAVVAGRLLPLFDSLATDDAWQVRHAALFALSALLARLDPPTRTALTLRTVPALSADSSPLVRVRAFETLGEVMYTFHDDPGGPPSALLALFLASESRAGYVDDDEDHEADDGHESLLATLTGKPTQADPTPPPPAVDEGRRALICAFNLPAVALTLGPARWHELRALYHRLAAARRPAVRRSLAAGAGALAGVLGAHLARADVRPVWAAALRADEPEVRAKAIEAAGELARTIGRGAIVRALAGAWDAGVLGWREREAAAHAVRAMIAPECAEDKDDDHEALLLLARSALGDSVAAVRTAGVALMPRATRALKRAKRGEAARFAGDVAALARNGVFRQRMTFVACFSALALPSASEAEEGAAVDPALWDAFAPLAEDPIVDVRIGVARVVGLMLREKPPRAPHPRALALADKLRADADAGVRAFVAQDAHPRTPAPPVVPGPEEVLYPFATFSLPPPPSAPPALPPSPPPLEQAPSSSSSLSPTTTRDPLPPKVSPGVDAQPSPQPSPPLPAPLARRRAGSISIAAPVPLRAESPLGRRLESPLGRRAESPLRRSDSPHGARTPDRRGEPQPAARRRSTSRSPHHAARRLAPLTPSAALSPALPPREPATPPFYGAPAAMQMQGLPSPFDELPPLMPPRRSGADIAAPWSSDAAEGAGGGSVTPPMRHAPMPPQEETLLGEVAPLERVGAGAAVAPPDEAAGSYFAQVGSVLQGAFKLPEKVPVLADLFSGQRGEDGEAESSASPPPEAPSELPKTRAASSPRVDKAEPVQRPTSPPRSPAQAPPPTPPRPEEHPAESSQRAQPAPEDDAKPAQSLASSSRSPAELPTPPRSEESLVTLPPAPHSVSIPQPATLPKVVLARDVASDASAKPPAPPAPASALWEASSAQDQEKRPSKEELGSGSQRPAPPSEVLARIVAPAPPTRPPTRPPLHSEPTARPASSRTVPALTSAASVASHTSLDVAPATSPRGSITSARPGPAPMQDTASSSSIASGSTASSGAPSYSTAASSVGSPVESAGMRLVKPAPSKRESDESDVTVRPRGRSEPAAQALAEPGAQGEGALSEPVLHKAEKRAWSPSKGAPALLPLPADSSTYAPADAPAETTTPQLGLAPPRPVAMGSSSSSSAKTLSGAGTPVALPAEDVHDSTRIGPAIVAEKQPLGSSTPSMPAAVSGHADVPAGLTDKVAASSARPPSLGNFKDTRRQSGIFAGGAAPEEATVPVTPTREREVVFAPVEASSSTGRRLS